MRLPLQQGVCVVVLVLSWTVSCVVSAELKSATRNLLSGDDSNHPNSASHDDTIHPARSFRLAASKRDFLSNGGNVKNPITNHANAKKQTQSESANEVDADESAQGKKRIGGRINKNHDSPRDDMQNILERRLRPVTDSSKPPKACDPPKEKLIIRCKRESVEACYAELMGAGVEIVQLMKDTIYFSVCVDDKQTQIPIIRNMADVEGTEDDPVRTVSEIKPTSDQGRRHLEQRTPYGVEMVRAVEFWNQYGKRGDGIRVCVIDGGIDATHRDLAETSLNGSNNEDLVVPWSEDGNGHGTHIAGILAAADNDLDIVGVSPNVDLYIVRVFNGEGVFTASTLIDAMQECVSAGSNIISMSLGGEFESPAEQQVVDELASQGILFVAAVGNAGLSDNHWEYPAGYANVTGVAAVDSNSEIARTSTYNSAVDLAAPGIDVESLNVGGTTTVRSGTSMSTPHVTGVAALLMSQFPLEPTSRIIEAMENTAIDLGPCGQDTVFGHGLVDAMAAATYLESGAVGRSDQQTACIETTVNTLTDDFGQEIRWFIRRQTSADSTEIVYRGGQYLNGVRANYTDTFFLPNDDGCYEFFVEDRQNDGTCCGYGEGSHELIFNGERIHFEDSFQTGEFCVAFGSCLSITCLDDPINFNPVCGNGIVEPGEECDDGDSNSNEAACTLVCQRARCMDGFLQPGEECDDGNKINTDGCTNTCKNPFCGDSILQAGEECDEGSANNNEGTCTLNCQNATCGDGFVQPGEDCDLGANNDNNGECTEICQRPRCGDGLLQEGEDCDDGNKINEDGCTNICVIANCGDYFIQEGVEECDLGYWENRDDGDCLADCTLPRCGDGIVRDGEECDNGSENSDQGACTTSCENARCGDGLVQAGVEECDEGDGNSNEGNCTPICQRPHCGDGILQSGEECDDGNESNEDECTNSCQNAMCGDGFVQPGEECDEGDNNNNEGNCTLNCQQARCGDGFLQANEECDEGGNNSNQGNCTNTCEIARCGDGFVQAGEQCDDGIGNNNVGLCTVTCQNPRCGDGFIQSDAGEQCDDGNSQGGDGCSSTCQNEISSSDVSLSDVSLSDISASSGLRGVTSMLLSLFAVLALR